MFKKNKFEVQNIQNVQNIQVDKLLLGMLLIIILLILLLSLVLFIIYSVRNCKCDKTLLKMGKENQEFLQVLNNHHKMNRKNISNERQIQNSKIVNLIKKLNDV